MAVIVKKKAGPVPIAEPSRLYTEKQAADLLGVAASTLATWRHLNKGPAWVRLGPRRVRYRGADVNLWLHRERVIPAG